MRKTLQSKAWKTARERVPGLVKQRENKVANRTGRRCNTVEGSRKPQREAKAAEERENDGNRSPDEEYGCAILLNNLLPNSLLFLRQIAEFSENLYTFAAIND